MNQAQFHYYKANKDESLHKTNSFEVKNILQHYLIQYKEHW